MLHFAIAFAVTALCAILNRMRGDDRWMFAESGKKLLPGRALYYVAPAIGLAAWVIVPWQQALVAAAGYLFWAAFSWGAVLRRVVGFPLDRALEPLDAVLMKLPGRYLPAFARMLFILPTIAGLTWFEYPDFSLTEIGVTALILSAEWAAIVVAIYRICAQPLRTETWLLAEILTGFMFGALIASFASTI